VEYGDGTSEPVNARLPEETRHTYTKPGRYVVIVRPSPPCVGKFSQALQVVQGAGAEPARITHIVASPTPGVTGQPLSVVVHGTGTCRYGIYYDDGSSQEVDGPLPQSTRHAYRRPGRYAIVVKAQPPCTGTFTEAVQVGRIPAGPRITRVTAGPTPAASRQPVNLLVDGSGACSFTIDYGDGNSDSKSMALPASFTHVYSAPGTYTVVVTPAEPPCSGSGRVTFEVVRQPRRQEVQ
jgi:plastocyanin